MSEILRLAWSNWYLTLGVLAAVVLPLWLMHILRGRRRRGRTLREKVKAKFGGARGPDLEHMLNWLSQESDRERRSSLRRGGPLLPVRIATARPDDATPTVTDEGLVLDRSTGGLCLAAEKPFRAGEEVFVRVENAAPELPWVAVVVRNCRNCGSFYLVGVEFRESLPLTVLLQFG